MNIRNLLPIPFFIGSVGSTKFARGERPRLGQGISLAAAGQPGDTAVDLPDWLYHSDPQIYKEEQAGRIEVTFSSAPTSGVVQPEIDGITGGLGGAVSIPVNESVHLTTKAAWTDVASVSVDFSRLTAISPTFVWDQLQTPGVGFAEVRLYNETDGGVLATLTGIGTTGTKTVPVPVFPAGNKTIVMQHQITVVAGGASKVKGGTLHTG